jgi:hypothetical protein
MIPNRLFHGTPAIPVILVMALIAAVSLVTFHGIGALGGKITCHQSGIFSCLYSICVVILTVPILAAFTLFYTLVLNSNLSFSTSSVSPLDRPPRI